MSEEEKERTLVGFAAAGTAMIFLGAYLVGGTFGIGMALIAYGFFAIIVMLCNL